MGTTKKLVKYHLGRLKDKNNEVRLAAIEELRKLADEEALAELKEVFHNDPDEEVRNAARDAGRAIFFQNQNGNAGDGTAS